MARIGEEMGGQERRFFGLERSRVSRIEDEWLG